MAERPEQYEQLTAYLDGELSLAERQEVERLLERDAEARQVLEELRRTSRLVAALPRGRAPVNMSASVIARLERQALLGDSEELRSRRRSSKGWARLLGVAASTAMILTAGWLTWRTNRPSPSRPAELALAEKGPREAREDESIRRALPGSPGAVRDAGRGMKKDQLGVAEYSVKRQGRMNAPAKESASGQAKSDQASNEPWTYDATREESAPKAREEMPSAFSITMADSAVPGGYSETTAPSGGGEVVGKAAVVAATEQQQQTAPARPAVSYGTQMYFDVKDSKVIQAGAAYSQSLPAETSNQLELVADADTRALLLANVRQFMQSNDIPDLQTAQLQAPMPDEQTFYYVEPGQAPDTSAPAGSQKQKDVRVVLNAAAPQVEQLIASMDAVTQQNRSKTEWTANAVQLSRVVAPDVVAQLRRNYEPLREKGESVAVAIEATGGYEAKRARRQSEMARNEVRGADREQSGGSRSARGGAPAATAGGGGNVREKATTQEAPLPEDFITLAISFRLPSVGPENAPGAPAAATPVPSSAPAQSQPASPGERR